MADPSTKKLMIGILICLILIALKPVPSFEYTPESEFDISSNESTVVQLGENRIAVIDNRFDSGMHGEIFVLEFNHDKKTFDLIGRYNFNDFFNNPQNYDMELQ